MFFLLFVLVDADTYYYRYQDVFSGLAQIFLGLWVAMPLFSYKIIGAALGFDKEPADILSEYSQN